MAKQFDPALKVLAEAGPADWLVLAGRPRRPVVTVEDPDVATVLGGAADKVFRVRDTTDYLFHLDFQAGHDSASLPPRLRMYNAVFEYRHGLPVMSVAVILHRGADSPALDGLIKRTLPGEGRPYTFFRYRVIRVWQLPPESLLSGGLGTLPLAPISDVTEGQVPGVIRRMGERLSAEPRRKASDLWAATFLLLGLRYSGEFARSVLQGVWGMKESVTYQAIVEEGVIKGRAEGARHMLLVLGEDRFGKPKAKTRAAIEAIEDVERLERLARGLLTANSWEELLAIEPAPRRRRQK